MPKVLIDEVWWIPHYISQIINEIIEPNNFQHLISQDNNIALYHGDADLICNWIGGVRRKDIATGKFNANGSYASTGFPESLFREGNKTIQFQVPSPWISIQYDSRGVESVGAHRPVFSISMDIMCDDSRAGVGG
jgi:hypothetical protein